MLRERVYLSVILFLTLKQVAAIQFDEATCSKQLIALTEAISEKKFWALKRKFLLKQLCFSGP